MVSTGGLLSRGVDLRSHVSGYHDVLLLSEVHLGRLPRGARALAGLAEVERLGSDVLVHRHAEDRDTDDGLWAWRSALAPLLVPGVPGPLDEELSLFSRLAGPRLVEGPALPRRALRAFQAQCRDDGDVPDGPTIRRVSVEVQGEGLELVVPRVAATIRGWHLAATGDVVRTDLEARVYDRVTVDRRGDRARLTFELDDDTQALLHGRADCLVEALEALVPEARILGVDLPEPNLTLG